MRRSLQWLTSVISRLLTVIGSFGRRIAAGYRTVSDWYEQLSKLTTTLLRMAFLLILFALPLLIPGQVQKVALFLRARDIKLPFVILPTTFQINQLALTEIFDNLRPPLRINNVAVVQRLDLICFVPQFDPGSEPPTVYKIAIWAILTNVLSDKIDLVPEETWVNTQTTNKWMRFELSETIQNPPSNRAVLRKICQAQNTRGASNVTEAQSFESDSKTPVALRMKHLGPDEIDSPFRRGQISLLQICMWTDQASIPEPLPEVPPSPGIDGCTLSRRFAIYRKVKEDSTVVFISKIVTLN
jgi:hypothetical protein